MGLLQVIAEMAFWAVIAAFVSQLAAIIAGRSIRWMGERFKFAKKTEAAPSSTTTPSPATKPTTNTPQGPSAFGDTTTPEVAAALHLLMTYYEQLAAKNSTGPLPIPQGNATHISTPQATYAVTHLIAEGDLCNVYRCTFNDNGRSRQGVFKITRDPVDNDLVENEARTLRFLHNRAGIDQYGPFLPSVQESLLYNDEVGKPSRLVNVLAMHPDIGSPMELYNLEEVRRHHGRIDPKDMAWMWRRVLAVLGFAHQHNVIHGAVLPTHILIEPVDHKLLLIDWSYAVQNPSKTNVVKAVSTPYEKWYPLEVFAKEPPSPALDIYMAAGAMLYLLGLTPPFVAGLAMMEPALQRYFERCLASKPNQRPHNADAMLDEFDNIIEGLWGPRQFRPFAMPAKL